MKKRVTIKSKKYFILVVAFLLCAAIIKMFYIAISPSVDGVNLSEFASSRNEKYKTIYAPRGTIYDVSGEALAISVNSYKLIAYLASSRTTDVNNPKHVIDKERTAKELSKILGMDEATILSYLNKDAYQVEFGTKGKNLTELVKRQIQDLELPGLDFIESTQRYYKMGDFASYVIGYAKNNDDGEIKGELGIESYFNENLSGVNGYRRYQSDAYGYQLPNVPSIEVDAQKGDDIYLTIDSNIQLIMENAMNKLEKGGSFEFALFSIADAKTGAIVASATSPSFNPNNLNSLKSYLNPLISYEYEPGSTMKIFSWASSIEDGLYDGSKKYKSGSIDVADVTIKDSNKTGWGEIDFDTGFAYSSNVGAVKLALALGGTKLKEYYLKYGFGKKTGIELPAEASGKINFYYPSEIATASFGQGVTITPIQMLQALTAIANNGVMLKPYIVDKVVDENGQIIYDGQKEELGQIMKATTANKMKDLMYKMNYEGLMSIYRPSKVTMVAKTGTAQIPNPKGGGYLTGKNDTIMSLAGIFPYEEPRYILYTAVKKYTGERTTYAKAITAAVDEIVAYTNISDKKEDTKADIKVLDNYVSSNTKSSSQKVTDMNLNSVVIGNGDYIIKQYPSEGSKLVENTKVFLLTNDTKYTMINLTGWSLNEVKTYCKLVGIKLRYSGNGYVISQSIKEETIVDPNKELVIELK